MATANAYARYTVSKASQHIQGRVEAKVSCSEARVKDFGNLKCATNVGGSELSTGGFRAKWANFYARGFYARGLSIPDGARP